jgi:hypothetical protein
MKKFAATFIGGAAKTFFGTVKEKGVVSPRICFHY